MWPPGRSSSFKQKPGNSETDLAGARNAGELSPGGGSPGLTSSHPEIMNDLQQTILSIAVDRGPIAVKTAADLAKAEWFEFERAGEALSRQGLLRYVEHESKPTSIAPTTSGRRLMKKLRRKERRQRRNEQS